MINYSRLGYEMKRDLSNFSSKISKSLKRPKEKFVQQMVYGILASNSVHLNEISRSLKETITLKKTIERISRNLHDLEDSQTIEAAVLSEAGKMPLPVYDRVFSAAEEGHVSTTYENLQCLEFLSKNFSPKCVRTLDRGFDANDYYRHFTQRGERFVVRSKKNRNVIYNGKTCNIMDVAKLYKGNYRLDFKGKNDWL